MNRKYKYGNDLIGYTEYQCPYCKILTELSEEYLSDRKVFYNSYKILYLCPKCKNLMNVDIKRKKIIKILKIDELKEMKVLYEKIESIIIAKKTKKFKKINLSKKYSLKGESKYFQRKYDTKNPIVRIDYIIIFKTESPKECDIKTWMELFRKNAKQEYGICPFLYHKRAIKESLPLDGIFYYTHIQNYGEIIHESEVGREYTK